MKYTCIACGCAITDKNTVGINKKLLGRNIKEFHCMSCLAEYLDVTVKELDERIEAFKEEGCTLFS